ncbi:D-tagatose 3-epimerase [Babesia caballi]|uniref:D-tagatose 3-epimerase n=1 Tax=Babesia caballi TaxID=5871 RepID=A0AAV4LS40_BABCB|nr:D-tagatose 3-epimerase [Babesia caballi]
MVTPKDPRSASGPLPRLLRRGLLRRAQRINKAVQTAGGNLLVAEVHVLVDVPGGKQAVEAEPEQRVVLAALAHFNPIRRIGVHLHLLHVVVQLVAHHVARALGGQSLKGQAAREQKGSPEGYGHAAGNEGRRAASEAQRPGQRRVATLGPFDQSDDVRGNRGELGLQVVHEVLRLLRYHGGVEHKVQQVAVVRVDGVAGHVRHGLHRFGTAVVTAQQRLQGEELVRGRKARPSSRGQRLVVAYLEVADGVDALAQAQRGQARPLILRGLRNGDEVGADRLAIADPQVRYGQAAGQRDPQVENVGGSVVVRALAQRALQDPHQTDHLRPGGLDHARILNRRLERLEAAAEKGEAFVQEVAEELRALHWQRFHQVAQEVEKRGEVEADGDQMHVHICQALRGVAQSEQHLLVALARLTRHENGCATRPPAGSLTES